MNGRNIVGQKPPTTRNNIVTCCVRLHGPLVEDLRVRIVDTGLVTEFGVRLCITL